MHSNKAVLVCREQGWICGREIQHCSAGVCDWSPFCAFQVVDTNGDLFNAHRIRACTKS